MEIEKSKFELSLKNGPHNKLSQLIGKWEGVSKVWFEKDILADESPISGTITSILDGRFVLHQYRSSMSEKPIEGLAIIAYSFELSNYQTAWVDSFHTGTGIMFSEGSETPAGHSVLGSYGADLPEPWGWRTDVDVISPTEIVISAYNIPPGEEGVKATEIRYHKVGD